MSLFEKKPKEEKEKKKKSTQQTIPFKQIYENGIIETKPTHFSKTYKLKDINFSIASADEQESIFTLYGELLNSIEGDVTFQITINNKTVDMSVFEKDVLIGYKGDKLDEYREIYNDILRTKLAQGRNNLTREKYLTVNLRANNFHDACDEFNRMDAQINLAIKKITHVNTEPMTTIERLNILYDVYNMNSDQPFNQKFIGIDGKEHDSFSIKELQKMGLTEKDAIAPPSIVFEKDYIEIGDKYARCLAMNNRLPASMKSSVLADIADAPFNMLTSIHYEALEMNEAVKLIKRQIVNINANVIAAQKKAIKNNYSPDLINPDLLKAQKEALGLLDDLSGRNQKMFFATLLVMVYADSLEELDAATKDIQGRVTRHLLKLMPLNYQQEQAMASVLPLSENIIANKRLLNTDASAVFMPFSVQEFSAKNGMYYGLNAVSNNMILYNRKNGNNYNGLILGTPGAGKSFSAKQEIINAILNTGDEVFVIDPEREYSPLMELLGGETVKIKLGGENFINPFDMDLEYADKDNPIALKVDFIQSLCDTICGGKYGLSPTQKSIIDRCVRQIYQPYLQMASNYKDMGEDCLYDMMPTLVDFYDTLLMQNQPEATQLALALETYAIGSLNVFSHQTNVNTNSRLVTYDIKDIGSSMKEMGLQICLNDVWNRIIANKRKGKWTWLFIDEFYLLTQTQTSAAFLQEIFKRARKWQGIPTGITQNVADMLCQKESRTIISNCDFIMMLRQAPLDKVELAAMLNISPAQLQYVTNSEPGQGLIYANDNIIPFINHFPSDNKLFEAMTTKPKDDGEK